VAKARQRSSYVIGGTEYAREELINKYFHLVKYVAGRISQNLPPNVEISDLINDGVIGLIDAVEKYDDDRGVKFETYAITRINGAIIDALRALDWVPRAIRQQARILERVINELETELGYAPPDELVAEKMGITSAQLATLQQKIRSTMIVSLEEPVASERGSDIPLVDTIKDSETDVSLAVEQGQMREALAEAVDGLPPQERTVIKNYYFENKTLKDIKEILGVSESRVSQIHAQAVIHLRGLLKEMREDVGVRENDPTVKQRYIRRLGDRRRISSR
jgi:RNA polymerase sigma factor for flagellar operon FliA